MVPSAWKLANITFIPKNLLWQTWISYVLYLLLILFIRLFERIIDKPAFKSPVSSDISSDQFAYKEGCYSSLALIKNQHIGLKWLDNKEADCIRVLEFDLSKAFVSVNYYTLFQ